MPDEVKKYLVQVDDVADIPARIEEYRRRGDEYINEIMAERRKRSPWKDSKNRKNTHGVDIELFSEEQLFNVEGYLYDRNEIAHLWPGVGHINHSSKVLNKLPITYGMDYIVTPYPLDQVLKGLVSPNSWCPYYSSYHGEQNHGYIETDEPFSPGHSAKIKFFYNRIPWTRNYAYHVYLKRKVTSRTVINYSDVTKIATLRDPNKMSPQSPTHVTKKYITDKRLLDAIQDFHHPPRNIPASLYSAFEDLGFKEKFPQKLYRGLSINSKLQVNDVYRVGDQFSLTSKENQSWTTDLCIAEKYAAY
jgi:hypothetical protein